MSTKNLARTVIEGGRTNHAKYLRRVSSRELRADNRRFCKKVREDSEFWYEEVLPQLDRLWLWKDEVHADKTSPCDRFLASRAGRPWDSVHSEICARFDRRKLAGMHVTNSHLLDRVEDSRKGDPYPGPVWYGKRDAYGPITRRFWIDNYGIFRVNRKLKY